MQEQLTKETIKCPECQGKQSAVYPAKSHPVNYKLQCVYNVCRKVFKLKNRIIVEVHLELKPIKRPV